MSATMSRERRIPSVLCKERPHRRLAGQRAMWPLRKHLNVLLVVSDVFLKPTNHRLPVGQIEDDEP